MASVSTTYITIVADFTQFRRDAIRHARDAGRDAARNFATSFKATLRTALGGLSFDVDVTPRISPAGLAAFRRQWQTFSAVFLRDQYINIIPQLNSATLLRILASTTVHAASNRAGREAGQSFGNGFASVLAKVFQIAVAKALLASSALSALLPLIGELTIAAGALGAALPAAITSFIALGAALKLAFVGVGDAVKQAFAADDPKKLQEALTKLAPAARAFVLELSSFRPQLKALQQDVQQSFFAPMLGGLSELMRSPALGLVRDLLRGIATDAGTAGRGILAVITNAARSGQLAQVFEPVRRSIAEILQAAPGLVQAFITLAQVGGRFAEILIKNLGFALQDFSNLVAKAAQDGSLQRLFEQGMQVISSFVSLLQDLGSIIFSVFSAVSAGGESVLGVIGNLADQFAAFLKTVEGQQALQTLAGILRLIGETIRIVVAPLLPVVAQLVAAIGGPLTTVLATVVPIVGRLVQVMADMLMPVIAALSPIIQQVAEILAEFLAAALTEVTKHISAMAPIAAQLAQQLGPALTPVVDALGEVLMALVPIIPAISQAIIQLMPLVMDLIPIFVNMAQVSATLITWLARVIEWFVKMSAGASQLSIAVIKAFADIARDVFNTFRWIGENIFRPIVDWMQVRIPHAFRTGVDLIEFWWNRLRDVARIPVRFFIETVVNKGIIGTFNKVAAILPGIPGLREIPMPPGFAVGGAYDGRLPGEPSDVDNMVGYGPSGKPVLLAGGEFIVNARQTRKNLALLEAINSGAEGFAPGGIFGAVLDPAGFIGDAVQGLISRIPGGGHMVAVAAAAAKRLLTIVIDFVKSKLSFGPGGAGPGFPPWPSGPGAQRGDSGVWRSIVALIRSTGPLSGTFGNGYRPGDPLWHGSGRAVDWMGFNQDALASFFMARRSQVLELIHRTNRRDYAVTRGRDRGSFNQTLMEQHRNHIHIAMAQGGRVMDGGGYMWPGWNPPTYNGTGRPEAVVPEGMPMNLSKETIRELARAIAWALTSGISSARERGRAYA